MPKTLDDVIGDLPVDHHREVETLAASFVEDEMTCVSCARPQRMAEALHISQDGVSRIEKRSDFLISTLRSYVEAMGGRLRLVVEFPDRKPITLTDLDSLETRAKSTRRPWKTPA